MVRQLRLNENLAGVKAGEQEARQNLENANLKEREAREQLNSVQARIDREEADQRRLRTETESAEQTCASMAARSKQFTMLAEEARERAQVAEDRLGTLRSARDEARALLEIHRKDDTAAEQAVDDAHEAHREAATHAEAARRTLAATARELDESIKRRQIWVERREKRQAEQKHAEESRSANQDRLNLAETMMEKRRSESAEANQHAEAAVAARQEAESAREIPRQGSIEGRKNFSTLKECWLGLVLSENTFRRASKRKKPSNWKTSLPQPRNSNPKTLMIQIERAVKNGSPPSAKKSERWDTSIWMPFKKNKNWMKTTRN